METKTTNTTDHLANERTFLAWVRTGIALMGFGFVIVKFAVFLRQVAVVLGDTKIYVPSKGHSALIGVVMVALGAVVSTLAYLRFKKIEKQIMHQQFYPSKWLTLIVTLILIAGSILLVVYLLPNI
jgi:putative membrane protein